jgi:hypothetical protein
VVGAALLAACSNDGDPDAAPTTTGERAATTTTTAPERPTSTTTTAFDPASVEGQVEAAYLRSWDVYAEAVYNLELDEAALADVYAEEALSLRTAEVERRSLEERPSLVRVEHDYEILVAGDGTANVVDHYVNHQVLIDPITKQPTEADPNDRLLVNSRMRLIDGEWRVVFIEKVS